MSISFCYCSHTNLTNPLKNHIFKNICVKEIDNIDNHFVKYSAQIKKDVHLAQEKKEETYIELITTIAC